MTLSRTRLGRAVLVLVAAVALSVFPAMASQAEPGDSGCTVAVSGAVGVGETITAVPACPAGAITFGAWYISDTPAIGPTGTAAPTPSTALTLEESYLGKYVHYYAQSFITSPYMMYTGSSHPTQVVRLSAVSGKLLVVGKARYKKTLTASPGALTPGVTAGYQWLRTTKKKHHAATTKPIPGATASTYKVKRKDVGKKVSVQVTYSQPHRTPSVLTTMPVKVH